MQVPAAPGSLNPLVQEVNETNYLLPETVPFSLCNMPTPLTIGHIFVLFHTWLSIHSYVPNNGCTLIGCPPAHFVGIIQAHLLFHTRRLVRERGALSPGHQTDPMCLSTACRHLARIVWESLSTSVAEKVWAPPGPSRSQCTFRDSLVQATIPAVHLDCSLNLVSTSPPMRTKGKSLQCCRPMTLTCIIFCHTAALAHFPKLKSSSLILSASVVLFIFELWQLNPLNHLYFCH